MSEASTRVHQDQIIGGRYRLLRIIGQGGMGSVYEAEHVSLGMRVAVKTLKPALADNTITSTRFVREGEVAARLHHPHAVAVYDVIEEMGISYLVMEYLEGETLKELLDREGVLSPARAADLLVPVLSAVATAHDEGIVHRDLKPSNIILGRERTGLITPKVLDFGLSWTAEEDRPAGDITRSGVVLGTLLYMAPEQVRSARKASAASDQYSLAVILYQCVTGHRPFLRDTQFDMMNAVVSGQHPPPRAVRPELTAELESVIERAMHVDPSLRYPSTMAFARALLGFASPYMQVMWAPVFELPSPDLAAPAPVSSLVPVAVSAPLAPESITDVVRFPSPDRGAGAWLSQSPPRAVLIGGAACVVCLGLGLLIGSSSRPETVAVTAPPPSPPPAAIAQAPTPAPVAPVAPAARVQAQVVVQRAPGAAHGPVVQQLRLDPAAAPPPPLVVDAGDGLYVPSYSSPQFLDRTRQQQLQQPPAPEEHGRHRGQ